MAAGSKGAGNRSKNTFEININPEYDKDSKISVYFSKHKLVENYTNCFRYQAPSSYSTPIIYRVNAKDRKPKNLNNEISES